MVSKYLLSLLKIYAAIFLMVVSVNSDANDICSKYEAMEISLGDYEVQFNRYKSQVRRTETDKKLYFWLEQTTCLGFEESLSEYLERYSDSDLHREEAKSLFERYLLTNSGGFNADILVSGIPLIREKAPQLALELYHYSLAGYSDNTSKRVALHGIMNVLEQLDFPCGISLYWYSELKKELVAGGSVASYYEDKVNSCEVKIIDMAQDALK